MKKINRQSGFTLLETMVAILILVLTIGAIFTLTAGSIFSVRYARNQIVANYLLQESLEAIRNSRDSAAQDPGFNWATWLNGFGACASGDGCIVDPYLVQGTLTVSGCTGTCPAVRYFPDGLYAYDNTYDNIGYGGSYDTSYVRTIRFEAQVDPEQYVVNGTITWLNGTLQKSLNQKILITNWQP